MFFFAAQPTFPMMTQFTLWGCLENSKKEYKIKRKENKRKGAGMRGSGSNGKGSI